MSHFNFKRARQYLKKFDFESLFIEELGWDYYTTPLKIIIDDQQITLQAVAEKRNVVVFICPIPTDDFPDYATRRKIDHQVTQSFREHIIIYVDEGRTSQIWQWMRREPGKPLASREHRYSTDHSGDSLLQKLQTIAFSLDEEEGLTLVDVTSRVRAAFNVERATKKFYNLFKKERDAFEKFLQGIPDQDLARWYVSVMLNRLMFIYFIQKKGFLNGDPDYLRHKLQQQDWQDGFYRDFLCPLFFQGFAQPKHPPQVKALLGQVPYLNGGIFERHQVEQLHGQTIQIPDKAFTRLFNFFDEYQWHLDDRPLRDDREINPDVLGYIFEKYINQKQMGAYYTKEDITEYISKNSIIPFLFDQARQKCRIAFEEEPSVWNLLAADPDRYIYPAVRHGANLPPDIAAGIDDVSQRGPWNSPTPDEYALPTEIWRETVARRQRYEAVRAKMGAGELREINDLITHNLDIQQFAQDVIEQSEGPELLRAFWQAINQVSILDPTCGSGAFLFAALNILEPLYEACLERMQGFVDDLPPDAHPQKFSDFKATLAQMEKHPNERYFIYKSIMINNLYGVDLMDEAVEIAKLRLFLKLAAQVERQPNLPNQGIEPLPDIDFNIRAGNTLVGFATRDEVRRAMESKQVGGGVSQGRMMFEEEEDALSRIETLAGDIDRLFQRFRQQQTELGGQVDPADKADLRRRLSELEDELNRALALQYGLDPNVRQPYEKWLKSHQPFHWFIEFYGILRAGGFDVIIGNPPYVEYSKIRGIYTLDNYQTLKTNNLYAFVSERSRDLLSSNGRLGFILPNSSVSANKMQTLQKLFTSKSICWISNFAWRPSKLFDGANMLLAIWIVANQQEHQCYSTRYNRWGAEFRTVLFTTLKYVEVTSLISPSRIPKSPGHLTHRILLKCSQLANEKTLKHHFVVSNGPYSLFYFRAVLYWLKVLIHPPIFKEDGKQKTTGEMKEVSFPDMETRNVVLALLSSNLFSLYYTIWSSCQVLNSADFEFPVDIPRLVNETGKEISYLAQDLIKDYEVNSEIQERHYSTRGRKFVMHKQYFYLKKSKPIIDEIDQVLAQHYGFTDEELDFIINYDIKYRMGSELFEDGEDEA